MYTREKNNNLRLGHYLKGKAVYVTEKLSTQGE